MSTTWREVLEAMLNGETVVAVAPGEYALDIPFDDGYGGPEGPDILIWTPTRVIFPVVYDGAEWLASAPRHPTAEGQSHVGSY